MDVRRDVGAAELEAERLDLLPPRTAPCGLFHLTIVVPVNIAIAINAASIGSVAQANALQGVWG